MKNKLFLFSFILIFTFLSVSFLQAKNASAQNTIFISMLSRIPGYNIAKDYGFIKNLARILPPLRREMNCAQMM